MNPYSNSMIINFPRGPYLSWFLFQGKCGMKYISGLEMSLVDITEISLQNTCCRFRGKWPFDLVSDFANTIL